MATCWWPVRRQRALLKSMARAVSSGNMPKTFGPRVCTAGSRLRCFMRRAAIWTLGVLAWFFVPLAGRAAEPDRLTDEQTLRGAGLSTDGGKLLDFLRKRTDPNVNREQIRTLVTQLADSSVEKREQAVGDRKS